jgi:DNA repair protein RecO (recombination protein O)
MDERALGLILRTRPLTETSLIVHWLTREHGRIATVAKGARRANSPFRGKLDLFYLADLSFARSRRSELHALREVGLRETHEVLRREMSRLRQASYCAALIEQSTETDTPMEAIFELMTGFLGQLTQVPPLACSLPAFELKLLAEQGLSPNLAESKLSGGARQIIRKLTDLDWPALSSLKLSEHQTREIERFLHGFLIFHLGKLPRARDAALEA